MAEDDSVWFKVVFVGDEGVGQTRIITRAAYKGFGGDHKPTIGMAYHTIRSMVEGETVDLIISEVACQERFLSTVPALIRGASVVVFVYSQNVPGSLESIDIYVERVMNSFSGDDRPSFFLVENMNTTEDHLYTQQQGREKAIQYSMNFHSVCADSDDNIDELITSIANSAYQRSKNQENHPQLLEQNEPQERKEQCQI